MSTGFEHRIGRRSMVLVIVVLLAAVLEAGLVPESVLAQDAAGANSAWLATYWNNLTLTGDPALTRHEPGIEYNWGYGSPDPNVNPQRFSARWTRPLCLEQAASYRFVLTSDDGARFYVDGELVINGWWAHGVRVFTASRQLAPGCHDLSVEYFELSGIAVVQFEAAPVGVTPPAPTPIPTPLPPPPASAPPPVSAVWRGEYYNNRYLVGAPVLIRDDPAISFDWGSGSPAPGAVNSDNFSVRWTQTLNFPAGLYRFWVTVDDGVRLYVDGRLVIDQWHEQGVTAFQSPDLALSGSTPIRLEYFDAIGQALVQLRFEAAGGVPAPAAPWLGEYFNNTAVLGAPVLVRNDPAIDFNWGYGSPAPGIVNHDNFSARWSQTLYFSPGTYRFRVRVDDGARLWINNALIVDRWQEQAATDYTGDIYLPGGSVPVQLEYVEYTGEAAIRLTWEMTSGGGSGGSVDTGGSTKTIKPKSKWNADYYNNPDLAGSPALVRADSAIDFDWGYGSPASSINADDFSVRWTNTFRFDRGKYRFTAEYDDGARVYVDGKLVIDDWRVGSVRKQSAEFDLDSGNHTVAMEYFERTGVAIARLKIVQFVSGSAPIGNLITCVPPQPQNYAWIKLYRLDGNNNWYAISKGIGSINPSGFLKIDGLPIDVARFGASGEPYKVEQWIDSRVVQSTGDFFAGQPEFRIRPWSDNTTPFGCP